MEMQGSLLQLIYTIDRHYQFSLNAQQLLGNATSIKIPFNPFLHLDLNGLNSTCVVSVSIYN